MSVHIGVVGGLNMDIHLFGVTREAGQAMYDAERYLAEPGGKGANQARAAAKLGADVVLVGRVGDDEFGRDCRDAVAADGVDARYVSSTPDARTGFVAIRLVEGHHQSMIYVPGANDLLTWSDVEAALHDLAECDVVLVQAEVPAEVLDRISAWAVEQKVPLLLDPAPPQRVQRHVLTRATAVTPDLEEGAALAGRAPSSPVAPVLAARDLLRSGARLVFLKLGGDGVLVADDHQIVRVPTLKVEPVDETGAGDVFIAALAVRRAQGVSWYEAARFANAASALSVSRPGLALPGAEETLQAVSRLPADNETIHLR